VLFNGMYIVVPALSVTSESALKPTALRSQRSSSFSKCGRHVRCERGWEVEECFGERRWRKRRDFFMVEAEKESKLP
jgi:hypothetical protein